MTGLSTLTKVTTHRRKPERPRYFRRHLESIKRGNEKVESLPAAELDHLLCKFFIEVRKVNGEEYEPGTLSGIQRSIQRLLTKTAALNINILKDKEFEKSRKVLAAKRKNLVNEADK